jgi:hypothetical protein
VKLRWVAAKVLIVGLLALVLFFTNDLFIMVQGSESTSFLITPTGTVQIASIAIVAIALLVPARRGLRIVGILVAIVAAMLGGHRLVFDNLNHQIRDVYLAVPMQSVSLDPAREGGLVVTASAAGFRIGPAGANDSLWCLSPLVIGLDRTALSRAVE